MPLSLRNKINIPIGLALAILAIVGVVSYQNVTRLDESANWVDHTHEVLGTIEAVKAVSELYAPLAGTVTDVNKALEGDPALVNRDPYGAGWMIKVRAKNAAELNQLLSSEAYKKQIGQ